VYGGSVQGCSSRGPNACRSRLRWTRGANNKGRNRQVVSSLGCTSSGGSRQQPLEGSSTEDAGDTE
jgi:hypothetical protein